MEVRRDRAILQLQDDLDQTADASGGLHMADVCLCRSDEQRPLGVASVGIDIAEGDDLYRIAQRRAGSVRLDVIDGSGGNAGIAKRGPDHLLLRRSVRNGQASAGARVVDGAALDDRQDGIAVVHRIGKALQHQHRGPFAPNIAVGRLVEGLAPPVGREHLRA